MKIFIYIIAILMMVNLFGGANASIDKGELLKHHTEFKRNGRVAGARRSRSPGRRRAMRIK